MRELRAVNVASNWKATKLRTFLLYSGPVVIEKVQAEDVYNNFLTLHVALCIFSFQTNSFSYYANELLQHIVSNFTRIYGTEYASHNVH